MLGDRGTCVCVGVNNLSTVVTWQQPVDSKSADLALTSARLTLQYTQFTGGLHKASPGTNCDVNGTAVLTKTGRNTTNHSQQAPVT